MSKVHQMLSNRYYLGYITYKGQEFDGRHEALIDDETFAQCQRIKAGRSAAGERRRIHHNYLKGSLYCGKCHQRGESRRMIIQKTRSK